jgi:hypothetical protein
MRFRWKMGVRELGLFYYDFFPSVLRTTRTRGCETGMPVPAAIVAFAFRKVINGPFPAIDWKQTLNISVFGTESISFSLAVILSHLSTDVRLTRRKIAVLLVLFSKAYVVQAFRPRSVWYIAS